MITLPFFKTLEKKSVQKKKQNKGYAFTCTF